MATTPDNWTEGRKARVGQLFDLLAASPAGMTVHEMADRLGIEVDTARATVRDLRLTFAASGITVSATPNGPRAPWIFELVADYEKARPWLNNRVGDLEARLETIESVSASIVHGARAGTVVWKKAKKIHRTIAYLREELVVIDGEAA